MTGSLHLRLSAAQADFIVREARRLHPQECCGLLTGRGEGDIVVVEVIPTDNISETPTRAFAVDPQKQFDVLRATRGSAVRTVGHYHSHPTGAAVPSVHDLAMARDPDAIWLIISAHGDLRAYQRPEDAEAFNEIPISISGEG